MFEIGWTEMLVIAVVMIVVVGPKDLPKMLRTFGRMTTKLRSMAGDFQKQFNEALKEAELDDVKKSVDSLRSLDPTAEIKKQLNPFEKAAADVRSGLDSLKPKPQDKPKVQASDEAVAAEPLKNGPAALPGEASAASSTTTASPVASIADPAKAAESPEITPAAGAVGASKAAGPGTTPRPASKVKAEKPQVAKPRAARKADAPAAAAPRKTAQKKKKTESSAT